MSYSPMRVASLFAAILTSVGMLSAPSAHAAQSSIYRCDMADGSVVFADKRCQGASRVVRWQPKAVPMGLNRTKHEPDKQAMSGVDSAPTLDGKDPYVDCQARGGKFYVAARLCRLPSANKPVIRLR